MSFQLAKKNCDNCFRYSKYNNHNITDGYKEKAMNALQKIINSNIPNGLNPKDIDFMKRYKNISSQGLVICAECEPKKNKSQKLVDFLKENNVLVA